jgi:hypothetical protein
MNSKIIIKVVCRYYNIDKTLLLSRTRKRDVIEKRQMLQRVLRDYLSLEATGLITGYDHATILSNVRTMNNLMDTIPKYKNDYEAIRTKLNSRNDATLQQVVQSWSNRTQWLKDKDYSLYKEMVLRMANLQEWVIRLGVV